MNRTVHSLLEQYDPQEIEKLLTLMAQFKGRFALVAAEMIELGQKNAMDERLMCGTITCECLLLAACMHPGNHDDFVRAAAAAFEDAADVRPPRTMSVQ